MNLTPEPIKQDDIVWVRWEDHFGSDHDPTRTITRVDIQRDSVRGKVLEVLDHPERPWADGALRVALGTGRIVVVYRGAWFRLDDPVDLLAHADGACPFCLGNIHGNLVSFYGTIKARCEVCYPPFVATPEIWQIPLRGIASNGAFTIQWTMTVQAESTAPVVQPRPGFRARARGRFRPEVSREERRRRLERMHSHGHRQQR